MAKRIERQDLIDIDGYKEGILEAQQVYKAFAEQSIQLAAQLKKAITGTVDEIKGLQAVSSNPSTTDKQLNAAIDRGKQLAAQLKDQRAASEALIDTEQRHGQTLTTLQARQDALIKQLGTLQGEDRKTSAQRRRAESELVSLAKQTDQLSKSSQAATAGAREITGQYNRMQRELSDARAKLRSMSDSFNESTGAINRNNAEAVRLAGIIDRNDTMLRKFDKTLASHSRSIGNYPKGVNGSVAALTDLAAKFLTLDAIVTGAKWFYTQSRDLENYDRALREVTDSEQDFANSKMYLIGLADKLGVEYTTLIDRYKQLRDATKDTVLEGEPAHKLFTALTTAGAKLGLSNEVIGGTLNAVIQIVGKGKAQLEEMRQQLGDRLPSALRLMSAGLGISQEKLFKLAEQGELLAKDVLPAFATQLGLAYSLKNDEKITAIAASTARVKNETSLLVDALNDNKAVSGFWDTFTAGVQRGLRNIRLFIQDGSYQELLTFFGPNSLSAKTAERARREDAVIDFAGKGEGDRFAKIEELRKLEAQQERDGLENDARITREIRRKLQDMDFRATVAEIKQSRKNEGLAQKGAVEKNEEDLVRFQKQSARKRTAELITLEKQLAKDKGNAELIAKLDAYTRLDAQQRTKEKQVTDRLKEQRGKSDAERQRERDALLREGLSLTKQQTGKQVAGLDTAKASGALGEVDYLNQRLAIVQDGLLKEQALLRKAGKEKSAEYEATEKEINELATWYLKERNDIESKAFKKAFDATKDAIGGDQTIAGGLLTRRLADLESAYEAETQAIERQLVKREITEQEAASRKYTLTIKYIDDVQRATESTYDTERQALARRIAELKAQGKTETEIAEATKLERENLDKIDQDRLNAQAKGDVDRAKTKEGSITNNLKLEQQKRDAILDKAAEVAIAAISGYTDVSNAFRERDLQRLEKQKEYELSLVGDNEEAKAAITKRFDAEALAAKRKAAIAEKAAALFQIAISTAVNLVKTGLSNPVLFGLTAALGLIQASVVGLRPLPEYFRGKGEGDNYEGPAWVGEKGYELIESKQNGKSQYRLAAEKQVTYLNRHDRVYTHQETKRMLTTNAELAQDVRSSPGGSLYQPSIVSGGATKSEMLEIMRQVFGEMTWEHTYIDERGLREYTQKQNNKTEWLNKRMSLPKSRK